MNAPLTMDALHFRERFLIWALRISFSPALSDAETSQALTHAFRLSRIELALPCFIQYANLIGTALQDAGGVIQMHCPPCPNVGRAEWHLVQALAALHTRDRVLARDYLATVVPVDSIDRICDCGRQLTLLLSRVNFVLRPAATRPPQFAHECHTHHAPAPSSEPTLVLH